MSVRSSQTQSSSTECLPRYHDGKTAIARETVRICADRYASRMRAIILTGSQVRDEGTFVPRGDFLTVLGDAEFLLVFHGRRSIPKPAQIDQLKCDIEDALTSQKIMCSIGLSAVDPSFLRNSQPSIFSYELKAQGQVLWGEAEILGLIPNMQAADIPIEDGLRLLQNRIAEMLDVPQDCDIDGELPEGVRYRTIKLYLDMATSLLVFARAYAPNYRARAQSLESLQLGMNDATQPLLTEDFVQQVSLCTDWKVTGKGPGSVMTWKSWEDAVSWAHHLWRWEVAVLTGCGLHSDDRELMTAYMGRQSVPERCKGWLFALRAQGWHRSWREWRRWASHARSASPRHLIYAAASEFLFGLPGTIRTTDTTNDTSRRWQSLLAYLPIRRSSFDEACDWRIVAREIFWNYKQFLIETRL